MLGNMTDVQNTTEKMAYSVDEIAELTTLSKAFIRGEIRAKNLNATKFGRRVLVIRSELEFWLEKGSKGRSEINK